MRKTISALLAIAFVFAIPALRAADTKSGTCLRRLTYLHNLELKGGAYTAEINLHPFGLKDMAPYVLEGPGAKGATYTIRLNGKEYGTVSGDKWSLELPLGSLIPTGNQIEIVVSGKDPNITDEERISLSGHFTAEKGPRMSARDLMAKHLDTSIPELQKVSSMASSGNVAGATAAFAAYVRKHFDLPESTKKSYLDPDDRDRYDTEHYGPMAKEYWAFSVGKYQFKEKRINWQFNPTWNGYCEWWCHVAYMTSMDYLVRLYALKHDEQAAAIARDQYQAFFEDEPVPLPGHVNIIWRSLEIGGRVQGIMPNGLYFLMKSKGTTDEFIVTFLCSIWEHMDSLRYHHAGGGNWLTTEMTGLFSATYLFPYFKENAEWREFSLGLINRELAQQVYPDGQQVELSTGYHIGVAKSFMRVPTICKFAGVEPPAECMRVIYRMLKPDMAMMRPDWRMPSLNDAGNARVDEFVKWGYGLFPERKGLRWFATTGKEGKPPKGLSGLLPYAGWVVMRNSWKPDAVWVQMDCAPFGIGHQHEDKLAIQAYAYGVEMLNEGGWFDYDTSEMRKYVLSTRSHNTIRIDGHDQNRMDGYRWDPADVNKKADVFFKTIKDKQDNPVVDIAEATYDEGYGERKQPKDFVTHKRRLLYFHQSEGLSPFFVVIDRLSVKDARVRTFEQIWHLQTGDFVKLENQFFLAKYPNGAGLAASFSDPESKVVDKRGQKKPEYQGWNPGRWDLHNATPIATPIYCGELKKTKRIVTVFHPLKGSGEYICAVKASTDIKDNTLTIVTSRGREIKLNEEGK